MPAQRAVAADGKPDFPDVRLHIVTGKGGTGKTTVAAALALGLAAHGKSVLLCETEGRQGIAQLLDVPPLPYEERLVAQGESTGAGDVYALAIDPESAFMEYLSMYYRLGRAGKALDRFGVIEFATTIAPGVRDVLLTGKIYEAAKRNRRNKGARHYDAIVLDAPPTGRIAQFLNVNNELAGLAKVGPIRVSGRQRHQPPPLEGDRDPPGHPARGDAGRGDRRRHRRAHRSRPSCRRRDREHGSPPGPRRRGAPAAARGQRRSQRAGRQPGERRAVRPRTPSSTR